jgi:hypothetical protein
MEIIIQQNNMLEFRLADDMSLKCQKQFAV